MRTAVVTGATSGIGNALARLLVKSGFRVIICGRRENVLADLKKELSAFGEVHCLKFDQRDLQDVQAAFSSLPEQWKQIDILINNAGNAHGLESLTEGDTADWDAMLDGNVKGLLYVSKVILPGMKSRGSGHVVNISSVAARQTYANGVVYCASKRAVDTISDGMRLELTEFGIKVTNIQPGLVETAFSEVRFKGDRERADAVYQGYKALEPIDVAEAILYCLKTPAHVAISDLTIYPSAQSEPRTVYKNLPE